jgi:hypothetical protein
MYFLNELPVSVTWLQFLSVTASTGPEKLKTADLNVLWFFSGFIVKTILGLRHAFGMRGSYLFAGVFALVDSAKS